MGLTERLARASSRHPWRVLLGWLAAIVLALGLAVTLLPGNLTTNGHVTNNPESAQAERIFYRDFPPDRRGVDELIVVRSATRTVADPAFRRFAAGLVARAKATGVVHRAAALAVSRDRHAVLIGIQRQADVDPLLPVVEQSNGQEGFSVAMTGEGTLDHDFNDLSQHDLKSGELEFGLPAALIVLLIVFGSVVAGLIPLMMAIISIVVALGLCGPIAAGFSLSVFFVNMLTGMGLALGIDYSLFVLSRYREERAAGRSELEAIADVGRDLQPRGALQRHGLRDRAERDAARALERDEEPGGRRDLGRRSSPCSRRSRCCRRCSACSATASTRCGCPGSAATPPAEGRFWGAIVRAVMRRPVVSLVTFGLLLLALAVPAFGLRLGASGVSTLPDRLESKQGFEALARDFPQQSSSPALIAVVGDVRSPRVRAGIVRLRRELAGDPVFGGGSDLRVAPDGRAAAIGVLVAGDKTGERALDGVRRLRSTVIPGAFRGADVRVLVGGDTADNVDFIDAMNAWLPLVFVYVLGLSFVLLTVVFRSIVVAATSIALNLLSVGAAYGLVILVFLHGWGTACSASSACTRSRPGCRCSSSRCCSGSRWTTRCSCSAGSRSATTGGDSTTEAVTHAVSSTARLITGAALIIVAVFGGFAMGDLVMFQQMGFGVAVALLIDATIIRSVLLPAAMRLLGSWNWYLPSWLEWLPRVEVEAGRTAS